MFCKGEDKYRDCLYHGDRLGPAQTGHAARQTEWSHGRVGSCIWAQIWDLGAVTAWGHGPGHSCNPLPACPCPWNLCRTMEGEDCSSALGPRPSPVPSPSCDPTPTHPAPKHCFLFSRGPILSTWLHMLPEWVLSLAVGMKRMGWGAQAAGLGSVDPEVGQLEGATTFGAARKRVKLLRHPSTAACQGTAWLVTHAMVCPCPGWDQDTRGRSDKIP